MLLVILVFLGGVLTILSPCILPVLPFVFTRAEQPFLKSGLPMLIGIALTFTGIAVLAAVGGAWAIHINQYGRIFALVLLTAFAVTLLSKSLAEKFARPFVALGNRLLQPSPSASSNAGLLNSLLVGLVTGLLWAPCAGPILGLVLTGAAISGPNVHTTLLLFTYAAGATASLAVALLAGKKLFAVLKKNLGTSEWIRRALGVAVLFGVVNSAFEWDASVVTRLSLSNTDQLEHSLIAAINPKALSKENNVAGDSDTSEGLAVKSELAALDGAIEWLNSSPLTTKSLKGKVVLIDFWTYSCINCLHSLPYVQGWYDKYKNYGLVVIGIHAPEFAFEKDPGNVRRAVADLKINYPVALDNNFAIWKAFNNQYWPALYFIDATGKVRDHHFGEGHYAESEETIRQLLTKAGFHNLPH